MSSSSEEHQKRMEVAKEFYHKSLDLRKEIMNLPTQLRDPAIHGAIQPFLREGEGITKRTVMVMREKALHRLVKEYFKREYHFDAYTDKEFWIRSRNFDIRGNGAFAHEETLIPDVFAGDPVPIGKLVIPKQLVVAEVKARVSKKSVQDCLKKVRRYRKFANRVYAAFSLERPFSREGFDSFCRIAPSDVGILVINPFANEIEAVKQLRPAKQHVPPDREKWEKYRDQLRCAKAWQEKGQRPESLTRSPWRDASEEEKRKAEAFISGEDEFEKFCEELDGILLGEPAESPD